MSDKFAIITDSGSDITPERAKEWNVKVIPLSYSVNDAEPVSGDTVDNKDFYNHLRNKDVTRTQAFGLSAALDVFEEELKNGNDVIYIGFSSALSSACGTAMRAAEESAENYPDRKVYALDSLSASLGLALLIHRAVEMRNSGNTIEEVRDYIDENKLKVCHVFTVDDLFFLKRGGRVSSATAVVGSMLAIKPILRMDNEGKLVSLTKARGRKASLEAIAQKAADEMTDPANQTLFICHGDCIEDAELLKEYVLQKVTPKEIIIDYIGPVIGSHAGVGTVSLFYIGTER